MKKIDNLEFINQICLGDFGCFKLHADCKRVSLVIFGKSDVVVELGDKDPNHYHRMDKKEFGELIQALQKLYSRMEEDKIWMR
jgi:hypothetical protein